MSYMYTKSSLWSHLLIVFLWKTFSHYFFFFFLLFLVCLSPTMSSNITPFFACHTQCKRNLWENTPQKETTEAYTNTNLGSPTDTLMFDILHLRGWKIAPCTWRGYYSVETYGPRAPGSTPMCSKRPKYSNEDMQTFMFDDLRDMRYSFNIYSVDSSRNKECIIKRD